MNAKLFLLNCMPIKAKWPKFLLKYAVEKRFKDAMGYKLDLKNPQSFNEKMQWYKLYYENPEVYRITDKYQFKYYVADKLNSNEFTASLFGHWYSIDDFVKDWCSLPKEFVLKSNMSFNGNNLKFITNKDEYDINNLAMELESWLDPRKTMMNTCLCRFNNARPCIIAEEYLKQEGHVPNDYKIFCFDGKAYCIYVATDHFDEEKSAISFYDLNWTKLDVKYANYKNNYVDKPAQLDQMLEIAKKLSFGFPFVRVDFFNIGDRLYLSELTFGSGDGHKKFTPASFDEELGAQSRLEVEKIINCSSLNFLF